jgi:hypothetical protein
VPVAGFGPSIGRRALLRLILSGLAGEGWRYWTLLKQAANPLLKVVTVGKVFDR